MAKTVLITGSSTGIGRITAEYFQAMGWNVAASMRNPEKEQELVKLENLKCIALDVSSESSIQLAIAETIKNFGGIDVIVNNAGYGAIGPFEAASIGQIRNQYETNLFGMMNVTRGILPHFREKKSGVIINIGASANVAWPLYSLYSGSKRAVEGFSESLQYELRPLGIKVKIIQPAISRTDFYGRSQEFIEKSDLPDYSAYVNTCMPNLQEAGALAPEPLAVAEKIFKAATDPSWRFLYRAGDTIWTRFLNAMLPVDVRLKMTRQAMERQKDRLRRYRDDE